MIGVEGHNPSGHCLIASKVVGCLPSSLDLGLPLPKKLAIDKDHQLNSSSKSRELSMVRVLSTECFQFQLFTLGHS